MRNRFGWLCRGTTPWGFQTSSYSTYLLTLFLSDTNIPPSATMKFFDSPSVIVNLLFPCVPPTTTATYLIFSNTTFYPNINKLQLSIKTTIRTGPHTQHITYNNDNNNNNEFISAYLFYMISALHPKIIYTKKEILYNKIPWNNQLKY